MSKIAYNYNKTTLEYSNTTQPAQLDPVATKMQGKEVYLCPANATFEQPLEPKKGYAIVFDKETNNWQYLIDYRGRRAYNDTGLIIINYIGKLQGSDKLLTKKQMEGIDDGTLIWQDGQIIEKPGPTIPEQIAELERQIETLNTKMLRDIIILQDENATEQAKQEAQTYFNNKVAQRAELIEQINELKNNDEE